MLSTLPLFERQGLLSVMQLSGSSGPGDSSTFAPTAAPQGSVAAPTSTPSTYEMPSDMPSDVPSDVPTTIGDASNNNRQLEQEPTLFQMTMDDSTIISDHSLQLCYFSTMFLTNEDLIEAVDSYIDAPCHPPIGEWDVSRVRDFVEVFADQTAFNEDISRWSTSRATDMTDMFSNATAFNQPIGRWDTRRVRDMSGMFEDAAAFDQHNLAQWSVGRVTSMQAMFRGATRFHGDLSAWDVTHVQDMTDMFRNAAHFDANLCSWWDSLTCLENPSSFDGMFVGATSCPIRTPKSKVSFCQLCEESVEPASLFD